MDSKLRRMAILSSMAVILLVSILVLKANKENSEGSSGIGGSRPSQTVEPPQAEGGASSGQIGNDLSAFLRDNTFFDPEPDPAADKNANDVVR